MAFGTWQEYGRLALPKLGSLRCGVNGASAGIAPTPSNLGVSKFIPCYHPRVVDRIGRHSYVEGAAGGASRRAVEGNDDQPFTAALVKAGAATILFALLGHLQQG